MKTLSSYDLALFHTRICLFYGAVDWTERPRAWQADALHDLQPQPGYPDLSFFGSFLASLNMEFGILLIRKLCVFETCDELVLYS